MKHRRVDDSDSYCRHCGRPFRKKVYNGMPDKKNVITHLQIIHVWAEFARERDLQFFTPKHLEDIAQWSDDALALLKEQEVKTGKWIDHTYDDDIECPFCHKKWNVIDICTETFDYCPGCGAKLS